MLRGRRLAFDYGDVRIGVAVCDPDGILATPVITLKNNEIIEERKYFSNLKKKKKKNACGCNCSIF